jgi:DNA-binding phage protein
MARASRDWEQGLAHDLRDPEFARRFILAAVEDGIPIQQAIGKVIRLAGVKEFAAKVRLDHSQVSRAIHPRHSPNQDMINRLLRPFRLKLSLVLLDKQKRRHVA